MKVIQMWSGGKDSTCACLKNIEKGFEVDCICYIPYFDNEVPLIRKPVFDFLYNTANKLCSLGARVFFTKGVTYFDWCLHTISRGSRLGAFRGYPVPLKGKCGFNRDSKSKACNQFIIDNNLSFDFIDIAIAFGEVGRKKLVLPERSILLEEHLTEFDCLSYCKNNPYNYNFLSPTYLYSFRDGCTLCPNAKPVERFFWYEDYKDFNIKERVLNLQRIIKSSYDSFSLKQVFPLRNFHYFIENEEFISPNGSRISIFGDTLL